MFFHGDKTTGLDFFSLLMDKLSTSLKPFSINRLQKLQTKHKKYKVALNKSTFTILATDQSPEFVDKGLQTILLKPIINSYFFLYTNSS